MAASATPSVTIVAHDVGGIGGMERALEQLVVHLTDAGHAVTLIARSCDLAPRQGLRWVRIRTPRRPFTIAYPLFFLAGSLAVRRKRRGVVHVTGAIVANRVDVATVHMYHRGYARRASRLRVSRQRWTYRLNARLAALMATTAERLCFTRGRTGALVAVSNGLADEIRADPPPRPPELRVIPNGVDTDAFGPAPGRREAVRRELAIGDDRLLAAFVGGEWEGKGLDVAIAGVAGTDDWDLLVVGAGDDERYASLAREHGVEHRIRFLGRRTDLADLYRACDAFVLPSVYETFSLVTYEAAASGLPLLVTRVSGVEEVLDDGVNGWFIDLDAADVTRRLDELGDDEERRARMGAAARAAALGRTWKAMTDGYAALYAELSARRP